MSKQRVKVTLKRVIYEEHIANVDYDAESKSPEFLCMQFENELPDNILNTNIVEFFELDIIEPEMDDE